MVFADSGPLTSGNVTLAQEAWTAYGPDLFVPAAAGDVVELIVAVQRSGSEGSAVVVNAANIVGGSVVGWWGEPNPASGNGARPGWYLDGSRYTTPSSPEVYTVQSGDLDAGVIRVRVHGRAEGAPLPTLRANSVFPGRIVLKNLGPAHPQT